MTILRFLLFNPLVKAYLNSNFWLLNLNLRFKAMILEMWFVLSVYIPLFLLVMVSEMFGVGQASQAATSLSWPSFVVFLAIMVTLFNKDFFNAKSPAHRKLGFQVVDVKTNQPANALRCMIRNITSPIWFVEPIFLMINPERRLGDIIAGTKLMRVSPSDPESVMGDIRSYSLERIGIIALLLSTIFNVLTMLYFSPN